MQNYSDIRKNKIMKFANEWVDLEKIMIELAETQKKEDNIKEAFLYSKGSTS